MQAVLAAPLAYTQGPGSCRHDVEDTEIAVRRNLLVTVIGNRNSGKSRTWNTLFGATVRTGKELRRLPLSEAEFVDVFLVSGSPEERDEYVGDLITVERPRIVLCSLQYREDVWQSFQYFFENDYSAFVHWLNPGYSDDPVQQFDSLGLIPRLLSAPTVVGIRDGIANLNSRVEELRQYIYGWADGNDLINEF